MAEFCLDCFNKINEKQLTKYDVWIDYEELYICEGCGELKYCIVDLYPKPFGEQIKDIIRKIKKDNGSASIVK